MAQFVYTSYEPNSIIIVVCSVLNSSPAWANYSLLIVTYCGETRGQDRQIHSSGTLPPTTLFFACKCTSHPPLVFDYLLPNPILLIVASLWLNYLMIVVWMFDYLLRMANICQLYLPHTRYTFACSCIPDPPLDFRKFSPPPNPADCCIILVGIFLSIVVWCLFLLPPNNASKCRGG